MSGHSKWHNIQAKKSVEDAKRGRIFTKVMREIIVAAKAGGGNTDTNSRLRTAVEKAKAAGMPMDNVKKAIQKGTGELEGASYEEIVYEGYGPGGTAFIIHVSTDNKNRTSSEIRKILSSHGGSLGEAGCVSWGFDKAGQLIIENSNISEDEFFMIAADSGANDMKKVDNSFYVFTKPEDLYKVKNSLEEKGITVKEASFTMIPKNTVKITGEDASKIVKLMEELDDHDDVSDFYSNFEIDDKELEILAKK